MKRKIILCALLLLFAFGGFAAGWSLGISDGKSSSQFELVLTHAFPASRKGKCVHPQPRDLDRYKLALNVLDVYGDSVNSSLRVGAIKVLSRGIYRKDGKRRILVCPPDGFYHQVGEVMAKHGMWDRYPLDDYELTLARNIDEVRPEVIAGIASTAFSERPQRSKILSYKDIRPMALSTLAVFGSEASSPYGKKAFNLMSSKDALGTGSAQVAVAAGYPGALEKVVAEINQLLSSVQVDVPIPWDIKWRLYELAYAISFAGRLEPDDLQPIYNIMDRQVQSYAPPNGMLNLRPKSLCALLQRISKEKKIVTKNYEFCEDNKVPRDS